MLAPSGEQYEIGGGGYRAVVTEAGATLRLLEHEGRPLLDGFPPDRMASGGRGQLLAPWPNRLRDGRYRVAGTTHQLALSEPRRHNASHGLVRWVSWTLEEQTPGSVSLVYRLVAQTGYPWTVDLHVLYDLSAEGLTVTQTATNMSGTAAPYAVGAHPYLLAGPTAAGPVDGWRLTLPAASRLLTDDRLLPTGREDVTGTDHDFRGGRVIGGTVLDTAFTDLDHEHGRVHVEVLDPDSGVGTVLWGDRNVRWLQVYSADDAGETARRSLAVEPMSAPPDAFNSGEDLVLLSPAGERGDEHSLSWGLRATR
jgi:aldose 1-epimerase